jgi:hypothetical protein
MRRPASQQQRDAFQQQIVNRDLFFSNSSPVSSINSGDVHNKANLGASSSKSATSPLTLSNQPLKDVPKLSLKAITEGEGS